MKSRNLLDVDFLPEKRHLYLIFIIILMVIVTNNSTMVNFTIHFTICLFYFQNVCMFSMLLEQMHTLQLIFSLFKILR